MCGLPWSLRYSGTPITEPGTYRIQAWAGKTHLPPAYHWYQYDDGVGVMAADETVGCST